MRRHLPHPLYAFSLLLAVACFYFSISDGLFAWLHPDEIVPSNAYNGRGLLGCTRYYYSDTTINRVTAAFNLCAMANLALWSSTPYMGWVIARLILYASVPIALGYFAKKFMRLPSALSYPAAFLLSSLGYFILADRHANMFGLDLAIYATATATFLLMMGMFFRALGIRRSFIGFCILYAWNLNSHEIFLVISGLWIPLYAWYAYAPLEGEKRSLIHLLKTSLKSRRIQILSAIYIASALLTLLAPGVKIRQDIWPSTGTPMHGLWHMVLGIEEALYFISRSYPLLLIALGIGAACGMVSKERPRTPAPKLLYTFIFLSPLMYLLITGFLIGLTPSLRAGMTRPEAFNFFEPYMPALYAELKGNGGFGIRQNLFLYLMLVANLFLAGFLIAQKAATWQMTQKTYQLAFASLTTALFLLHPDGIGSMHQLRLLATSTTEAPKISTPPYTILNSGLTNSASNFLFKRSWNHGNIVGLTAIPIDHYLKTNRYVPPEILDPLYAVMNAGYDLRKDRAWITQIFSLYGVTPEDSCIHLLPSHPEAHCHFTSGEKELTAALKTKAPTAPTPLNFQTTTGATLTLSGTSCPELKDVKVRGEHYAAVNNLLLSKGLNYFTFEAEPGETEVYIYVIGKNSTILFSWVNHPSWSTIWGGSFKPEGDLTPIFSQSETGSGKEKLTIVLNSIEQQPIQLRWQHGKEGSTSYRGRSYQTSRICSASHGTLSTRAKR